jgi:hypothetical protein
MSGVCRVGVFRSLSSEAAVTLPMPREREHLPLRMTTSPHDALFKIAFGQPEIARSGART